MKKQKRELIVRNNKLVVMLILLIAITFGLIVFTSIKLYENLDTKVEEKSNYNFNNKVYGTVLEVGENYAKIQELNNDKVYLINTDKSLEEGDLLVAYFDELDTTYQKTSKIEVIASNREFIDTTETTVSTTPIITTSYISTTIPTTSIQTTIKENTKKITDTSKIKKTIKKENDDDVINYFANEYSTVSNYSNDKNFLDKAKDKFIFIVDFIFYDGEIKGKKFNDLTSSAKAKVIYYDLLIDSKIDSKWPNYKENINNKYIDIKSKLIAKYLDLTASVCDNNPDTCADFKRDFNLLKSSVGLTWDVLKEAFNYAYNTGKEKLVLWYEMFSGKV